MAKINRVSAQPQYHTVKIDVDDPECLFSIKPKITYNKVFKSYSVNTAIKAAASYCNKYMKLYPVAYFKYSTDNVEPYYYPITKEFSKEKDDGIIKTKI